MNLVNKIEIKNFYDGVDLKWNTKQVNILIGASGSGKSYLLNKILGQFTSQFRDKNPELVCEYNNNFRQMLDPLEVLYLTNNPLMYSNNLPRIGEEHLIFLRDFLNERFFKVNYRGDRVSYKMVDDNFGILTMENDKYTIERLSDTYMKILYVFSRMYIKKNYPWNVIIADNFFDTMDMFLQRDIIMFMKDINPEAQFFISTNSPFMFDKHNLSDDTVSMHGLLTKREN